MARVARRGGREPRVDAAGAHTLGGTSALPPADLEDRKRNESLDVDPAGFRRHPRSGGGAAAQEQPLKEPAEPAAPEDSAQIDDGGMDISFNVGVASDYVFRGVSQTDEGGQLFAGADLTAGSLYAGVWASNVDFSAFGDTETSAEVDVYAGIKPEFGGFVLDFAGIYYAYLNQPPGSAELNYVELKAAALPRDRPGELRRRVLLFTGFYGRSRAGDLHRAERGFHDQRPLLRLGRGRAPVVRRP
jgi:hypothetical protein